MTKGKFAVEIGITREYLSTLIHHGKKIKPWILEKALEISQQPLENITPSVILHDPQAPYRVQPNEDDCRRYLEQFLARCEKDPARLGWTLTELREKFPLNKWPKKD